MLLPDLVAVGTTMGADLQIPLVRYLVLVPDFFDLKAAKNFVKKCRILKHFVSTRSRTDDVLVQDTNLF